MSTGARNADPSAAPMPPARVRIAARTATRAGVVIAAVAALIAGVPSWPSVVSTRISSSRLLMVVPQKVGTIKQAAACRAYVVISADLLDMAPASRPPPRPKTSAVRKRSAPTIEMMACVVPIVAR
jgi:hypothetical protein